MKRSGVFGAAFVSILFIGCEGGAPNLSSLPEGDPVVLEPGYASLPPNWRTFPAIEILSSGGFDGGGTGNVQIWEDGTVLFDGAGCPNGSSRRGKMSPARVRAVIDELEEANFFMWPRAREGGCPDSFITSLTVQRAHANNTVVDMGCGSKLRLAAKAIELVKKAVGNNPCAPSCRETPAPAFCH